MITQPTLEALKEVILSKGYKIFGGDGAYHLNIGGIRDTAAKPNTFGDTIYVFFADENGVEQLNCFQGTTVPGRYWLQNPMNVAGTFVMKEGQYVGCWKTGLHKQTYPAMVQVGDITGYRDADLDALPETGQPGEQIVTGSTFNIELHHAGSYGATPSVNNDKWSAGCQVLAAENDLTFIMDKARKSNALRQNLFSYTLLNRNDF